MFVNSMPRYEILSDEATLEAYGPPPIDEAVRAQLQEFVARRCKELGD